MSFKNFLDLINIAEETYFVKKDGVLKAASITGTRVMSAIGNYRGEEIERIPDEFVINAQKFADIWGQATNDMSLSLEDNVLTLEDRKRKKITIRMKDIKNKKIPELKINMDIMFVSLGKEDIEQILDYKRLTDGINVTFFMEKSTCDIIVKSIIPGNESLIKCDLLNKLSEGITYSYPKEFFDILKKANMNKSGVDVYFGVETDENNEPILNAPLKSSPIKLLVKDDNGEVEYYIAPRSGEVENKQKPKK
jgi:hypothetical protein